MIFNGFRERLGEIAVWVNEKYGVNPYKLTRGELCLLARISSEQLQKFLPLAIQDGLLQQVTDEAEPGEFFRLVNAEGLAESYKTYKLAKDQRSFYLRFTLVACSLLFILVVGWRATVSWWGAAYAEKVLETKERNIAVIKECVSLFAEYEEASPKLKAYALQLLKDKECPVESPATQPEPSK